MRACNDAYKEEQGVSMCSGQIIIVGVTDVATSSSTTGHGKPSFEWRRDFYWAPACMARRVLFCL